MSGNYAAERGATTASPSTLFVTASGRVVDVFAPRAIDVDFDDVVEHLSKEARYNGGTPGEFYSVAQHLCLGADWLLAESSGEHDAIGREDPPFAWKASEAARASAAYFLAHDFHEYVLKDETTPKKRALDRVALEFGSLAGVISDAYARLVERWDAAIHAAAGLAWPPPAEVRAAVDALDRRLLLTEWAALHRGHRLLGDYSAWAPLPITIEPWPWDFAHEQLARRMALLLPALRAKSGAADAGTRG